MGAQREVNKAPEPPLPSHTDIALEMHVEAFLRISPRRKREAYLSALVELMDEQEQMADRKLVQMPGADPKPVTKARRDAVAWFRWRIGFIRARLKGR